jgi:uncharacterized protein YbjT (DUF2867 family)
VRVLVTGANGYVGARLVPRLLAAGHRVRCMVRDPARLQGRPWVERVEVESGDVLDAATLTSPLSQIDVAVYLVHSLATGGRFETLDVDAARTFGRAAAAAGVQRIVYLGGLGNPADRLSAHLRSRQATGDALREAGVPVTELRAAVVVGSGSLSFELIRYLVERLPVMVCPSWVYTRIQPIAIDDVLDYLVTVVDAPEASGLTLEIGGADVLTYGEMMTRYATLRGLRRWLIPVPVLTPRLSSYWVHLVTPIPTATARPLIEGLRNEVVVRDGRARQVCPNVRPIGYDEAVRRAVAGLEGDGLESVWSDAQASSHMTGRPVTLSSHEGLERERRELVVEATPASVFRIVSSLGGATGWLTWNWAWRLRGRIDRLIGGVGMRRGRRHPYDLRVGDAVDFWRVEAVEPGRLLRLRAEMRVPGRAWLEFQIAPVDDRRTEIVQTAYFAPRGLVGVLYWYALYPIHGFIFGGMLREVARRAHDLDAGSVR